MFSPFCFEKKGAKMVYARFTQSLSNVTTTPVTQWDYGRKLRIEGLKLPTAVRIDIGVSGSGTTKSRIGIAKDGVTDVVIPDIFLEQSNDLVAYVYVNDTTEGKTVKTIHIPVIAREEPEEHDTPENKQLFAEAIELINDVADRVEVAENTAKSHADSAKESLDSTQQISSNFNETAANAVKSVIDAGTAQIQAVNNTKTEAVNAIQTEGAAQFEQIQVAGEVIVNTAAIAEQNAKNVLANAIKGNLSGEIVTADDVSPIEHVMDVKVICPDGVDPSTVKVRRCGKNLFDITNFIGKANTVNGVTAQVKEDGCVHVSGSPIDTSVSTTIDLSHSKDAPKFPKGTYIYSNNAIRANENILCFPQANNSITGSWLANFLPTGGEISAEFSIRHVVVFIKQGVVGDVSSKFYLQVETGNNATEFEPFKDISTCTPTSDGTVSGMMSTAPNMTILTDTEGVVIDCEYNVDTKTYIDKKFDELKSMINV